MVYPKNDGNKPLPNHKKLLIVGPIPPPIGGSSQTVLMLIEELAARHPYLQIALVNTSPSLDPRKKMTGFSFEKVHRWTIIIPKYIREIWNCDAVLVFANPLFALTIVPVLLLVARIFHKPFYIKPVGGDLDLFIDAQNVLIRRFFLFVLRNANGLLIQTQLLLNSLRMKGCTNVHYIPGFRTLTQGKKLHTPTREECKIIFLAHITREKGPLILLEAINDLAKTGSNNITCDFFGIVHHDIEDEFFQLLGSTPNATYCGVADAGIGSSLIARYDVLVLPTYFSCEGHPGVIIEAMHAGVPVISTQYRAIPELIIDGINGILVPVQDSRCLALAIRQLASDSTLRRKMGNENYIRGQEFRSDVVISKMLEIIFSDPANSICRN